MDLIDKCVNNKTTNYFFDKPIANLDIDAEQEFTKIFEILKERNITLFITTHLANKMSKIADYLIILKRRNNMQ
ncbi:hypothetical protein [Spiroplasma endosymbiont of Labia minor]|uniref:hypothetical protein n=1 Tax=Spiroplasma endosymbiont of Labia minor TaxID=3066305 RepID=UPI0030D5ECD7